MRWRVRIDVRDGEPKTAEILEAPGWWGRLWRRSVVRYELVFLTRHQSPDGHSGWHYANTRRPLVSGSSRDEHLLRLMEASPLDRDWVLVEDHRRLPEARALASE